MSYSTSLQLRFQLFGFLFIAGVIAATAGPSSAILMIPQNRTWPTGSINFYLNGTVDQLWPSILTGSDIGGPGCDLPEATSDPHCAAGGYVPLKAHYDNLNINPLMDFSFIVTDNVTTRVLQGNIRNSWETGSESFMQSPHVATGALEEPIRQAWSLALRNITANVPSGSAAL